MPPKMRITRSKAKEILDSNRSPDDEGIAGGDRTVQEPPIVIGSKMPSTSNLAKSPPAVTHQQFQELMAMTRQLQSMIEGARDGREEGGDSSTATSSAQGRRSRHAQPPNSIREPLSPIRESDQEDRQKHRKKEKKKRRDQESARVRAEIQELKAMIARKDEEPISWSREGLTPFAATLIRDAKRFKPPVMDTFNGAEDPRNHIRKFDQIMRLCGASDSQKCLAFSATLTGDASTWYNSLPSGAFYSFDQFAEAFVMNFAAFMCHKKHANHLASVIQTRDETLREYSIRFEKERRAVESPDERYAIETYTQGLYYPEFRGMMLRDPPRTWNALMARASREMAVDEDRRKRIKSHQQNQQTQRANETSHKKKEGSQASASEQKAHAPPSPIQGVSQEVANVGGNSNPRSGSRPDYSNRVYTPLKASLSQILREIRSMPDSEEVQPEPKMIPYGGSRQNEYCDYHKVSGHSTNYCWSLKNMVERKIAEGNLKRFVDDRKSTGQNKMSQEPCTYEGVIH